MPTIVTTIINSMIVKPCDEKTGHVRLPIPVLGPIKRQLLAVSRDIVHVFSAPVFHTRRVPITAQMPVRGSGHGIRRDGPQIPLHRRSSHAGLLTRQLDAQQHVQRLGIAVVAGRFLTAQSVLDASRAGQRVSVPRPFKTKRIDGRPDDPQILPQLDFLGPFGGDFREGQRHRGKDGENGQGDEQFEQRDTGLFHRTLTTPLASPAPSGPSGPSCLAACRRSGDTPGALATNVRRSRRPSSFVALAERCRRSSTTPSADCGATATAALPASVPNTSPSAASRNSMIFGSKSKVNVSVSNPCTFFAMTSTRNSLPV